MAIRVVLADDHRIVRDGLCALLARETDIEVVGQADDGLAAVRLARQLQPDVVVTDVSMPGLNGVEAIRRIRADAPAVRVLCLSVHAESRMVLAVLEAGASGYVLKDDSYDDLALAIRKAMSDQVHLSAELVGLVVNAVRGRGQPHQDGHASVLTPREREMVQLLSEGLSTQQIADRLHVSPKTVATHREHVMQKLEICSLAELTRFALREGLSSLELPWRTSARMPI
ncbi:response regulator [Pseudorhodoferax soli]|uniref:LuxR family two component transcriptional regulator n=1 Tax=Pseudorhodoferax soli TaxID=545864 RepID=A0A368Y880_9BURK|nr:response regulator transcription factor [Pseudorhodoferax soli]RCW76463.1 LuxR family two component transcriptional regulator [Pseudorhodoferax soli]